MKEDVLDYIRKHPVWYVTLCHYPEKYDDLLDEIGIKYTPGDYGITLEKEDNKFLVDIGPKSFMMFKMKHIKKEDE